MTVEAPKVFIRPPERLVRAAIGDIEGFKRIDPSIRRSLFGYFLDHLTMVCREGFPSSAEAQMQVARSLMYQKFGVVQDLIERGELAILASQISHLQDRQESGGIVSKPGELWTNVMVAAEMNVTGFDNLNSVRMNAAQNHLRVFLRAIDGTWGYNGLMINGRLPDHGDWQRYQKSSEAAFAAGLNPRVLKHAELIAAAVFVKHYQAKLGGKMNG